MGRLFERWPAWLLPDDQAGDFYQWAVVASGHVVLGAVAFAALAFTLGRFAAGVACLAAYLVIEAVQLFALGGTLTDGLTDAFFVLGGMVAGDEALRREPGGFSVMLLAMGLGIFVGVVLRL